MATRCSKHPFYYEPCKICSEMNHHKLLVKSAESEMKETEFWNKKLGEELDNFKDLVKEQREEISDLKRVLHHAEESAKKYAEQTCELQAELDEALESVEKLSNLAYKSYNPEAKLKLSVNDLLVVRGIFVANSFLFNSLHNIDDCIANKKDETTKEQLTLIKKDLEKEWQRVVDLLKVFAKEFSNSNWDRMIRETQKIVKVSVDTMNRRDLGHFTVDKEESLDVEYKVRPLVVKAVNNCINSAGTNSLTAYSKELLIKELTKICEEK